MSTGDHDDIRDLLNRWIDATREKDVDGIMSCGSETIRTFSLAPPLETTGNDRAGLQAWFDTWDGNLEFRIENTDLRLGGDTAWMSALAYMAGSKTGQPKSGFWFRLTLAFAREDGRWRIVHIHESVPFAMDGQPLALFNLQP